MTATDLDALACGDCPATITKTRGEGLFGGVLVVTVLHDPSCPWLARVAPDGATMSTPAGIVIHRTEP